MNSFINTLVISGLTFAVVVGFLGLVAFMIGY